MLLPMWKSTLKSDTSGGPVSPHPGEGGCMFRAPAGNGIVLARPLTEDGLRLPEADAPFFAAPPRPGARLGLPSSKHY